MGVSASVSGHLAWIQILLVAAITHFSRLTKLATSIRAFYNANFARSRVPLGLVPVASFEHLSRLVSATKNYLFVNKS